MSSCSMGLNAWGFKLDGKYTPNPGTLNDWLKRNGGYSDNNLNEAALNKIRAGMWGANGMHRTQDLTSLQLKTLLKDSIVIANVHAGRHFVLVTDYNTLTPDRINVHDPGFDVDHYSISGDVVGWRILSPRAA